MPLDVTFRLRVASIMESLTAAVVQEVCQIMDESFNAFRLEMTLREMEGIKIRLEGLQTPDQEECPRTEWVHDEKESRRLCLAVGHPVEDCRSITTRAAAEDDRAGGFISVDGHLSTETIAKQEAVDEVHVSVRGENSLPPLERCSDCCSLYHCPFCKTSKYKPTKKSKILPHLQSHLSRAVRYRGYSILRCNLECRPSGHHHCPFCKATVMRRENFLCHLNKCKAKDGPPPTATTSQSNPTHLKNEHPIMSPEVRGETTTGQSDPTHLKNEHPITSAEARGETTTSQSDPTDLGDPFWVPPRVERRTMCHTCGLSLDAKNLRKHILRRHPEGGPLPRQRTYTDRPVRRRMGVATATCGICSRVMCLKNLRVHMERWHPSDQ